MLTEAGESRIERVLAQVDADDAVWPRWPVSASSRPRPRRAPARRAGPAAAGPDRRRRSGSLHDYRAAGGYEALRRAFELGPAGVIREVKDSGLMGRGGAAFPTGVKWEAVAQQPVRPHYLICNADESEPGTFKDRVLLEGDPFALIEAMTIAAYATGCEHGYLYLRGEYPVAHARLEPRARRSPATTATWAPTSSSTASTSTSRSAAAPAPTSAARRPRSSTRSRATGASRAPSRRSRSQSGCSASRRWSTTSRRSTTCCRVLLEGGPAFAQIGTEKSTGTKLFCVSGHVARPGVYEVAFGTTLGELLELAGGVPGGHALQAVLLGGAAGAFVGPDPLDLPLTFEGARAAGATLGSGVVIGLRRDRRHPGRSSCGSPPSSATSPAGSARRAGSARCARRRRWPGSVERPCPRQRGRRAGPARRARHLHARLVDLRPGPDRRRTRSPRRSRRLNVFASEAA